MGLNKLLEDNNIETPSQKAITCVAFIACCAVLIEVSFILFKLLFVVPIVVVIVVGTPIALYLYFKLTDGS